MVVYKSLKTLYFAISDGHPYTEQRPETAESKRTILF